MGVECDMGKRSHFERREADFYPTPRAAVVPLIPHLRGIRNFAEPCAGDGALIRHLEEFGLRCVYAGDIRDRSGCACARLLRRGRCDHYQSALVARGVARAGHALPEHRADVAAAGRGLEANPPGGAVPAPLLGHRGDWPGEMDRGFQVYRQGQCLLVQVRFETHGRPRLPRARPGPEIPSTQPESASNAASVTSRRRSSARFCSPSVQAASLSQET